uniref:Uncharacterized protein LOC100183824 n=1 Tax=Phallusia mammillata TaxID=59560 RepID=A0A6F9DIN7_9ASCI|nr:uncharacterized protein LOC100183824 [Phallusia mammillata]
MAKSPPSLNQSEAFLKSIQLYYYEQLMRSKLPQHPNAHCDETQARLQWAVRRDEDGDTPLHIAVAKGDEVLTRELITCLSKGNVSIDMRNNLMQTPFHIAVITDNPTLAALLMDASPTCIDVTDRYGNNGVHLAVQNSGRETEYAILRNVVASAKLSTLEKKNLDGFAPMHLAAQLNNSRAVTLLRQGGADVNILDNKGGVSPIVLATRASRREAAQALLELGANPNLRTTYGETASQVASARSDRAISELLAFYDTPYDVTRPSTSSQHSNNDFEKSRPNKPAHPTSQPRGTFPSMKPDVHVSAFSPPVDVMSSQRQRIHDNTQASVKVERNSPNKNPPFPESSARCENKNDHRQDAVRTQRDDIRHYYPNFSVPLLPPFIAQPTAIVPFPTTSVVTQQRVDSNKRKTPNNDEPLDLSTKRRKPALEKSSSHPANLSSHPANLNSTHPRPPPKRSEPAEPRDTVPSNHRLPPPYPQQRSVIVSSYASRQRRYRSDDDYRGNQRSEASLSDVEKQALERRRSAPEDLKRTQAYSGRRQMDLRSYTGCLPPHYLHLLESSGNLPSRTNHVLRNVADIFGGSRPAMASSDGRVTSAEPSVATSVIVMSSRDESAPGRHLAEKGCRSQPSTNDVIINDVTVTETSLHTSPTRSPTTSRSGEPSRSSKTTNKVTDCDFVTMQTSQSGENNRFGDATINPTSSKYPCLGVRQCVAISNKHTCPGCTNHSKPDNSTSSFDLNVLRTFNKYVTASSTSATKLVFCSEILRKKVPAPRGKISSNATKPPVSSQSNPPSENNEIVSSQLPAVTSQSPGEQPQSQQNHLIVKSFSKSSFSDSDCIDVASNDSGTDVTEPIDPKPREFPRTSRKNSLDAKLDQLRKRALDSHQSHYKRACAEETTVTSQKTSDVCDDVCSDQEDINPIEDSDCEDDEILDETSTEVNHPALPPNDVFRQPVPVHNIREMAPKSKEPIRVNGHRHPPSNFVIRNRVTPDHRRVAPKGMVTLQHSATLQERLWWDYLYYQQRSKIPPSLLFYYDVQRQLLAQKQGKIQIFPPKNKKISTIDPEACPDDLELCDLEISDDEEGQTHFPNGLKKRRLVY